MNLRLGELFSGPGGIALGASKAGFSHAWAVDFDQHSCATFLRNIPGATKESVVCASVRDADLAALPAIDVLAFGFPCNSFSLVGEKRGLQSKEFGDLYKYGVKVLKSHQPLAFVAENVSGLSSANQGRAYQQILKDLKDCGYVLFPHLYRFEDYGVPQARHRIVIVGIREDLRKTFVPPVTHDRKVSCAEALLDMPAELPNHEIRWPSKLVQERLSLIKPGQNVFNADLPKRLQLNVQGARISQIYRRLHPDKPAYTVTGSGGGGTMMYHWEHTRALTNRERARLQTFPDDFIFSGGSQAVRKQIGMAVPPVAAHQIFQALNVCLS